jgi:hypothetical protein
MFIDTIPTFRLIVPCNGCTTIKKLLAAGHYDWTSPDLTDAHFPLKRKGTTQVLVEPVDFGLSRIISNCDAQTALKQRGINPATIEHLLTFGATYPDEQRKYPIVALGSVARVHNYPCVPFLATDGSSRFAGILTWEDEWSSAMRFLAIRHQSPSDLSP